MNKNIIYTCEFLIKFQIMLKFLNFLAMQIPALQAQHNLAM